MKKNLLWMAAAIVSCGLAFTACAVDDVPSSPNQGEGVNTDEWEIDFFALSQKYVDKQGITISAAVFDNVGTTSIVDGTLKEAAEDGSTTASEDFPKFALQEKTNWFFYTSKGKTGLYQGNGGGRTFGVLGAKQDQVISIEVTEAPTVKIGDVELFSKTDSSYVYYVNSDCDVVFNLARYNVISNISVKNFVGAEYTVRFIDSTGKKLKDDVKHKGEIGKPVNLLPSDIAPIDLEDGRMVFDKANNTETNVVKKDGSTVVTILFRPAEKYYVVLNCMAGSTLLYRYNDADKYWFYEGDALTLYPSRGITKDGATYFTPSNNNLKNGVPQYNGVEIAFPGSFTPTVSGGKTYYIGTLNYEKDENCVYYSDIERLAMSTEEGGLGQLEGTVNSWISYNGVIFNRFSGGRGIRLDADSYVWTEPIEEAGTYNVIIYGRNDSSDECAAPYVLGLRDAEGKITWFEDLTIPAWVGAVTGESVVENVTIPAGSSLVIKNDDAAKLISLDDIKVKKPAAAEE